VTVEFETEATFEAVVDSASLRDARDTVAEELGDIEVQVDAVAQTNGGGGAGAGASKERAMGRRLQSEQLDALADIQDGLDTAVAPDSVLDAWDTSLELDETRNELLEELVDQVEENGRRMRTPRPGGGGGIGLLIAGAAGAAGLGAAGLTTALKEFDIDFPDSIPLTGAPDGIPLTGAPDAIDVDAPEDIPVDAPTSIPLETPFPVPIPVASAVVDVVETVTGSEAPTGTGETQSTPEQTGGGSDPMTGDEISENVREQLGGTGDGGTGSGSGEVTPIPRDEQLGQDRPDPNADYTLRDDPNAGADSGALANLPPSDQIAGGLGVTGLATGAAWGAGFFGGGGAGAGGAAPGGIGLPAVPGLGAQTEGGREILRDILDRGLSASSNGGGGGTAPTMSISPLVNTGGGGGGGSAASGNRSTTRRTETRVEMNIDAGDSRNAREVAEKVRRKTDELERRLREIERVGRGTGL
jgi:hypothetical protein